MTLRGGRGDLRNWIGEHLDPLEAHDPAHARPAASDYDLSRAYGPAESDAPTFARRQWRRFSDEFC